MTIFDPKNSTARHGIEKCAILLGQSRAPIIVVNRVDLAGAAAAVALARQAGAVLDHTAETGLAPAQEQGTLGTVPGEAHVRADLVIIAGPVTDRLAEDTAFRRLASPSSSRTVIRIGNAEISEELFASAESFTLGGQGLSEQLGILSAIAQGRPVNLADNLAGEAKRFFAEKLSNAKYGVFVFAPDAIDPLAQFAMMSLANTLSAETRWTVLPLGRPRGQAELIRMSQALSGLPPPLSFAGVRPVHDRLVYRAPDLIRRGEADAILWVSACEEMLPDWIDDLPLAAVTARPDAIPSATTQISIGKPGIDHAGLSEDDVTGFVTADAQTSAVTKDSAAQILGAITDQLVASQTGAAA
jgi:formylmethanofuran dehydrogenase subunit B